jgi:hypothetical protein
MHKGKDNRSSQICRTSPFVAFLFLLFVTYLYFASNNNCFPTTSSISQLSSTTVQKSFQEFFEANEKIRARFIEKREQILFKKAGPSETILWPKENVYVWHYFPPDFTCPHLLERIGSPSDGGKWMCGVELFEGRYQRKLNCITQQKKLISLFVPKRESGRMRNIFHWCGSRIII